MSVADQRPNPDLLLTQVQAEDLQARRGRLKIFFGYAAGVGKTYAMLQAGQRAKAAGVDVVVGYVEPHGRQETEALLAGLEQLPTRSCEHRGVTLQEFDLDRALDRRPALILVDELAHTNAPGSRHTKRWQDILELLAAGIDVYSSLNVQHIESLNDVIAGVTGVIVRETLPDAVLENADEIELIDITPDQLRDRLQAGKIYLPQQAERAINNFFLKTNLVALRELSLRQAANRIRRDVDSAHQRRAAKQPWLTNERLLVCVGPSPSSAKVLRASKRLAASLDAPWLAVSVDTGHGSAANSTVAAQTSAHLHLAEQLGAETHTLVGTNVAETILNYARERNVSKIVLGKTAAPLWQRMWKAPLVDQLLAESGEIDIYVIRGDEAESRTPHPAPAAPVPDKRPYWYALVAVAVGTMIGFVCDWLGMGEGNLSMLFLLCVVFVATRYGGGPAIIASLAGVLSFDFFFVPPRWTFAVHDTQYIVTFVVMLFVGLLVSRLTNQVREQLRAAQERERRTHALYRLSRQLGEANGSEFLVQMAGRQLQEIFQAQVVIYLPHGQELSLRFGGHTQIAKDSQNFTVAEWVSRQQQPAGWKTDTLPQATALFLPLVGTQHNLGVVGIRPQEEWRLQDPEERRLLESCAAQIALALERDELALAAHTAELRVEAEELRNSLLSSVSHDLRTPLAAIAGAGTSLLSAADTISPQTKAELLETIVDESQRLTRLVENLLDMTRLEAGKLQLHLQWQVLEELLGSALARLKKPLALRPLKVEIAEQFPLIQVDGLLFEQMLVNLLENAARYTPPDSPITIAASMTGGELLLEVRDRGPGLPSGKEELIFDKFYRSAGRLPDGQRGVGLGLAICRAIATAHQGTIRAYNQPGGGAVFEVRLPCSANPPQVPNLELPESPLPLKN
ncbi:MAG: sensor histidine kinase KdpD [Pirellulales bacterium]|nr:sensor histidine kinase KdpD [Pirellulales bacterium]